MPYSLPNITNGSSGIEQLLIYESQQVSSFVPMLLFFFFAVIAGAGIYSQERRVGRANVPMWLAIAGFIVSIGSIILYLIPGFVSLEVLIITMVLTIVFTMWFLLSGDEQ